MTATASHITDTGELRAKKGKRYAPILIFAAVLALTPLALPNAYYTDVVIRIEANASLAVALNLLIGYTGQISLGHAGFYGLGAYGSAILTSQYGAAPLSALLVTAFFVALLAFAVSRIILRLEGHYLAMATLGLGIIVTIVLTNESAYTGGPDGMSVPGFTVLGLSIDGERSWYWIFSALLLVSITLAANLVDSPAGRALRMLHGSEIAARVCGIDALSFKTRIFVLSAVAASVIGSLSAHYIGFITPGIAGFSMSVQLVTMVVAGGMATIWGPVAGAALLSALPELLAGFEGAETIAFGAILVAVMIFLPRGIVPSLVARLKRSD